MRRRSVQRMTADDGRVKLGWIGMGQIGTPMVLRLLAAGHNVTVWGRNVERLAPALAAGASAATSAAAVAARCEAVFLCVLDDAAVSDVVFGPAGIAAGAPPGTLVVDHSTIHPQTTVDAARRATALRWVDAPVSGGVGGAAAGTLSVFLGGEPAAVERVRPWLAAYARNITHFGPTGSGQIAKACNQAVVCATVAIWAEALNLARDGGLDPGLVVEALAGGWADSAIRAALGPGIAARDSPLESLGLFVKDLDIVRDFARARRAPTIISDLVSSLFRDVERGAGRRGVAGLTDLYGRRDP